MSEIESPPRKHNEWLNGKPFTISMATQKGFEAVRKPLICKLCGKTLKVGNDARWVYANGTAGMGCGNFFVCVVCDGPDVMKRAKESFDLALKLGKQWGLI